MMDHSETPIFIRIEGLWRLMLTMRTMHLLKVRLLMLKARILGLSLLKTCKVIWIREYTLTHLNHSLVLWVISIGNLALIN